MDGHDHVYRLDMGAAMQQLRETLTERGYLLREVDNGLWEITTHWRRGPAYGEIGAVLFTIIAMELREIPRE